MLKEQLKQVLQTSGLVDDIELIVPPNSAMGDFSFACFELAKKQKKSPVEVANDIKKKIDSLSQRRIHENDTVEKVETIGPYVNFYLNASKVAELVLTEANKKDFGKNNLGKGKKILVEYGCPNPMKVFHLGHLKNLITGESVARVLENAGFEVVRVNYQGDVGLHQAKAMWAINSHKSEVISLMSKSLDIRIAFLGQMYVNGAQAYEKDEQAKAEILEMNEKIYEQDESIWKIYEQARYWSLEYFDELYKKLNVKFDRLYFESEMFRRGKAIVVEYLKTGIFQESAGAIIFAGSQHGLHDRVFINSKGYPTYEAKELALAETHDKDYKPDKIIHVVGKEQTEYFKVVFKAMEKIWPGLKKKEYHLPGGYLQLKGQQKMSSRTGNIIAGDELLKQTENKVNEIMVDRVSANKNEVIRKVTGAVLKYAMLKSDVTKDVGFDMVSSVSLSGDSGPYLLYIVARIKSILRKCQMPNIKCQINYKVQISNDIKQPEKELLLKISEYPEIARSTVESLDPSKIAQYLFSLAQKFNSFYDNCPILQANDKSVKIFRLEVIKAVEKVIGSGLALLGIEIVEEM